MYSQSTQASDALRLATLRLKSACAVQRIDLALSAMAEAIEAKYRPDQPRAPKGTPEGGQWIIDLGSARQRRLGGERVRVAQRMGRITFSGPLVRQNYISARNETECTYYDSREDYYFTIPWFGDCPYGWLHY